MEGNTTQVILLAVIGIFGGKEIWAYFTKRAELKALSAKEGNEGESALQQEIKKIFENQIEANKENIKNLEDKLSKMEIDKDECKAQIADLSTRVAVLTERLLKYSMQSRGAKKKD